MLRARARRPADTAPESHNLLVRTTLVSSVSDRKQCRRRVSVGEGRSSIFDLCPAKGDLRSVCILKGQSTWIGVARGGPFRTIYDSWGELVRRCFCWCLGCWERRVRRGRKGVSEPSVFPRECPGCTGGCLGRSPGRTAWLTRENPGPEAQPNQRTPGATQRWRSCCPGSPRPPGPWNWAAPTPGPHCVNQAKRFFPLLRTGRTGTTPPLPMYCTPPLHRRTVRRLSEGGARCAPSLRRALLLVQESLLD